MSNNPPEVVVKMDRKTAEFLLENCETNIAFSLGTLQTVSRETAVKLVELIENFKATSVAIKAGLEDR